MAEAIKQATGILTLKATVLKAESPAQIELSLERFRTGQNILENVWKVAAADLGASLEIAPRGDAPLTLPSAILNPLVYAVDQAADDFGWREPLWLHFVKPYGILGALDWEERLSADLARPVFRLPDFLEGLRSHPSRMEVAIVADLPMEHEASETISQAVTLLEALRDGLRYWPAHFNLFASARWRRELARAIDQTDVTVHEPPPEGGGWLEWISNSLAGRRLDWVQFLVAADASELTPSLVFTASPGAEAGEVAPTYASPLAVALGLNRISAWGCGFTSPSAGGPAALRYFADAVAQTRPGPVLFENLEREFWPATLSTRLQCLFFPEPRELQVPPNPGGFLYVQPDRIGMLLDVGVGGQTSAAVGGQSSPEPAWVASANAFITSARQEWGLETALGSLSASASLVERGQWTANTVGAFERAAPVGPSALSSTADDTLKALSDLTRSTFSGGHDS